MNIVGTRMFEWDENKNEANLEKHGIDFNDALRVLLVPRWEERSDQHGQRRWKATAKINGIYMTVVYTISQQAGAYRLISARPANYEEAKAYQDKYR